MKGGFKKGVGPVNRRGRPDFGDLDAVIDGLRKGFASSDDVSIRTLRLGIDRNVKAAVLYIHGMVDARTLHQDVIRPLTGSPCPAGGRLRGALPRVIAEQVLPASGVRLSTSYGLVIRSVMNGDTAVFVDGGRQALIVETRGFPKRSVGGPETELNVKGSFEAFNETLGDNLTLIRRRVQTPRLRVKTLKVGGESRNTVALVYIEGIVNPAVVKEAVRRIRAIKTDALLLSATLQSFISDKPWTVFPLYRDTERPDLVAQNLLNGKAVILTENTPFALIIPSTLGDFLSSTEDYTDTAWGATFIRLIRVIATLTGLYLPSIYVSFLSMHPELLPTDLMLSILGSREGIAFPPAVEASLMLVIVEVLREASIRLPTAMGPTLGIVGGLILGQAVVSARVVSDQMLIVVSLTAISLFVTPAFEISSAWRILNWAFLILSFFLGLYGVVLGTLVLLTHLASLSSFGVPYLSPASPLRAEFFKDFIIRAPIWSTRKRPSYLHPLDAEKAVKRASIRIPDLRRAKKRALAGRRRGGGGRGRGGGG